MMPHDVTDELYPEGYKTVPDADKTEADWEIQERIMDFAQAAFQAHWYKCSKYLDAYLGGRQTSIDLHNLCQGFALALLHERQNVTQSDKAAAEQYWDAEDKADEVEHLAQAFAAHAKAAAAEERARVVAIIRDVANSFCECDGYEMRAQIEFRLKANERGDHIQEK